MNQPMERRTAIKQMALLCASAMLLPSCLQGGGKMANIGLKHIAVTEAQEKLMAELVETIIPKTDTPGAKELGVHLFVFKMVDDCYPKAEQDQFLDGLKDFEDKKFEENTTRQRIDLLKEIMQEKNAESNLQYFLKEVRKQTLKGYTQSEYVMTELRPYILVPGQFLGSVRR